MYKMIIQSIDGLRKRRKGIGEEENNTLFFNYFLMPFFAGIAGFATFLFMVIIFEYAVHLAGIISPLRLDITEVKFASLGFVLQFVYKVLQSRD